MASNPRVSGASRIQRRLLVAFLCVTLIPLAGVGVYSVHFTVSLLERTAVDSMVSRTLLKARETERLLTDAKSDLFFLSQNPSLRSLLEALDKGTPEQIDFLRRKVGQQFVLFATTRHLYSEITYIDQSGAEVVRADCRSAGVSLAEKEALMRRENSDYFARTIDLSPGQVYVFTSPGSGAEREGESLIRYSTKVFSRYGRKCVITLTILADSLLNVVGGTEGVTLLVDGKGEAIARVRKEPAGRVGRLSDVAGRSTASRILSGSSGILRDDPSWMISYVPVLAATSGRRDLGAYSGWCLVDFHSRRELFAPVRTYAGIFTLLAVASLAAALYLTVFLARRFTLPLVALRDAAHSFGLGDLSRRAQDLRTGDEIEDLAFEFNRMADRLSAAHTGLEERIAEKTAELERANSRLLQSEKLAAIGTLAAGIAHEINNPLDGLINCLSRIRRHPEDIRRSRAYLDLMEEALTRITRTVRRLLDFSRRHELRLTNTSLNDVVEAALSLVSYQISQAGVQITKALASDLPMTMGDNHYLQQVLVNLFLNSLQAMPGGGTLTVVTRYTEDPAAGTEGHEVGDGQWLEVAISDTGVGIPEAEIGKIFDPFYTTKGVGEGTGLGLSISYSIVKEHNGAIDVQSEPSRGTTFTIRLPATYDSPDS